MHLPGRARFCRAIQWAVFLHSVGFIFISMERAREAECALPLELGFEYGPVYVIT